MPYSAMILEWGGELNEYPLDWEYSFYWIVAVMACKLDSHNELGGCM